jgi:hypothetical protein
MMGQRVENPDLVAINAAALIDPRSFDRSPQGN